MTFALLSVAVLGSAVVESARRHDQGHRRGALCRRPRLMNIGDYATACPKLAASQRLGSGDWHRLNLADCYEKSGRFASAWAEFRGAATAAHSAGSSDREQLASDRAQALVTKLSYLTITTSPAQAAAIQIIRDGSPVEQRGTRDAHPDRSRSSRHRSESPRQGSLVRSVRHRRRRPRKSRSRSRSSRRNRATRGAAASRDTGRTAQPGRAQRAIGIGVGVVGVLGVTRGNHIRPTSEVDLGRRQIALQRPTRRVCDQAAVNLGQDAAGRAATRPWPSSSEAPGSSAGRVLYFTAPKDAPEKALVATGFAVLRTGRGLADVLGKLHPQRTLLFPGSFSE